MNFGAGAGWSGRIGPAGVTRPRPRARLRRMTPSAPLTGFLRDLEALEARQHDVAFEAILARVDEDRRRAGRFLVKQYSKYLWPLALQLSRGHDDSEEFSAEIFRPVFVRRAASADAVPGPGVAPESEVSDPDECRQEGVS